ncbi:MAG TPA: M28 family peptidase [Puia sp.]|nr:M28 family peptidase [Puia sp.]
MNCIDLIKQLDYKPNNKRREIVIERLKELQVEYWMQEYGTGINLIVDLGAVEKRIGISSHFDRIPETPGANDNSSGMAVCIEIIKKFKEEMDPAIGLRIFFFDEEETGLKGSSAYVREYGVKDMVGLINFELVGIGDKFAIWPVNPNSSGALLEAFEHSASSAMVEAIRFDKIVTNTADHLSFRKAGLSDAFTITCISDKEIEAAGRYYKAIQQGLDAAFLMEILAGTPAFENYHQPGDSYKKIKESSILMTSSVVLDTIMNLG